MPELEFHERAKGFADALLANRTYSILKCLETQEGTIALNEEEQSVLEQAVALVSSCEAGLSATKQQSAGEMGFLAWMESLRACETALDALVRAELVHAEKDIAYTLGVAKAALQQITSGKRPPDLSDAVRFFDALSEINIEAAAESEPGPSQQLQRRKNFSREPCRTEGRTAWRLRMNNDRLIGDCVVRASALHDHAERVANADFPGDEPPELARAIGSLAQALAEHLLLVRGLKSYRPETAAKLIRIVDGLIKWLYEPLRFADGAATSRVPWSLVRPLQGFAQRIVPNTALLIRPKWRYNYSVVLSDLVADIRRAVEYALSSKKIDECLGGLRERLHIISFPFLERRSVLLHAALVHEIGHLVVEEYMASEKASCPESLQKEIVKSAVADTATTPLYETKEIKKGRLREVLRRLSACAEYRKRAVQEIGADLVGLYLLGPAAIFAVYGIVGIRSPDKIPTADGRRYPPRRLRLRICMDEIKKHLRGLINWRRLDTLLSREEEPLQGECRNLLKGYRHQVQELMDFAKPMSDRAALKQDKVVDIAYRWVDLSVPKLSEYVRSRCMGKSELLAKETNDKKPKAHAGGGFLVKALLLAQCRLGRDLPPNTLDDTQDPPEPAAFETVLNAGWLYLLGGEKRPAEKEKMHEFIEWRQRVERLTLRALEVASLQNVYNERHLKAATK